MTETMTDERALDLLRGAIEDSMFPNHNGVRSQALDHIAVRLAQTQDYALLECKNEQLRNRLKACETALEERDARLMAQQPAAAVPDEETKIVLFPGMPALPKWTFDYAARLSAYMDLNHPGYWAIDGVCKRYPDRAASQPGQVAVPDGITGEVVEIGDDENGQPRIIINTTADEIRAHAANILFKRVQVTAAQQPAGDEP